MKIYIASRSSDRKLVKKLNKRLEQSGHIIFDWTWHKNTKPYEKHRKLAKDYSIDDLTYVKRCDVFILIASEFPGAGSMTELGMALFSYSCFRKPKIYVVGSYINNMFFYHPSVTLLQSIEKVMEKLERV